MRFGGILTELETVTEHKTQGEDLKRISFKELWSFYVEYILQIVDLSNGTQYLILKIRRAFVLCLFSYALNVFKNYVFAVFFNSSLIFLNMNLS